MSKGLLKSYNIDDKGVEHMNMFAWEGWWTSDMNSFLWGEKAFFNIDVLEDAELLMITLADYEAMTLKVPIMDRYFRILFQNSIVTKERRLVSSTTHSAEEKYMQLVESNAVIFQRIPQNLIASYLGITPETLSRIKNHTASHKQS